MSCSPQLLPIHCNRQRQSQDAGETKSDPIQHCSVLRVISVTTIALTDYPVSINLTNFVYMLNFVTHAQDAGKIESNATLLLRVILITAIAYCVTRAPL